MAGVETDRAAAPAVARAAVEAWVRDGRRVGSELPRLGRFEGGVFVALKLMGELRGAAGALRVAAGELAEVIAEQAVVAASADPRFEPVEVAELPLLSYAVDLLGPPEPLDGLGVLDPVRDALLVEAGERQGLVLPVEGVETAAEALDLARASAGIAPGERARLWRLPVRHLAEPAFDRRRPVMDDDDE